MSDTKPSDLLIGFVVFTMAVVGVMSFMGGFAAFDPNWVDDEYTAFNDTFNKQAELTERIEGLQGDIEEDDESGFLDFGVLGSLIKKGWNILRLFLTNFNFITSIFTGLGGVLDIPAWIGGMVSLLIIIIVVFAVISAVFQTKT